MKEEKIDAIVAWVDGSDPAFRTKKKKALEETFGYELAKDAISDQRYIEVNEIYYCLNLLRKNAPWLNSIYLITDNQRPEWLSESESERLGVNLVDHKDIFSGYESYLPTFNSCSIETMSVRIPELSEKAIYLNDDFFIIRPVEPSDFFEGETLVVRGRWGLKNYALEKKFRRLTFWHRHGYICRRPGVERLPGLLRYLDLAHAPQAIFKSDFEKIFPDDIKEKNIRYKFRAEKQLTPYGFVINMMRKKRPMVKLDSDWLYLLPETIEKGDSLFDYLASRKKCKFLCLQDLCDLDTHHLKRIQLELDAILSNDVDYIGRLNYEFNFGPRAKKRRFE